MKKYVLILVLSMYMSMAKSQVCVPDPALQSSGISPLSLPPAMAGYLYWTTLSFFIPKDSFIMVGPNTVPLTIDSAKLVAVVGYPSGFSMACNTPRCVWLGGNKGCALFSGMVDSTFIPDSIAQKEYPIKIYIQTWARFQGGTDVFSRVDSNTTYVFRLRKYNSVAEIVKYTPLTAYPNPTTGTVTIELRNLDNEVNEVSITDMFGKSIMQKSFPKGDSFLQTYTADLSGYAPGLYFVTLKSGNKSGMAKVQLQ